MLLVTKINEIKSLWSYRQCTHSLGPTLRSRDKTLPQSVVSPTRWHLVEPTGEDGPLRSRAAQISMWAGSTRSHSSEPKHLILTPDPHLPLAFVDRILPRSHSGLHTVCSYPALATTAQIQSLQTCKHQPHIPRSQPLAL